VGQALILVNFVTYCATQNSDSRYFSNPVDIGLHACLCMCLCVHACVYVCVYHVHFISTHYCMASLAKAKTGGMFAQIIKNACISVLISFNST